MAMKHQGPSGSSGCPGCGGQNTRPVRVDEIGAEFRRHMLNVVRQFRCVETESQKVEWVLADGGKTGHMERRGGDA